MGWFKSFIDFFKPIPKRPWEPTELTETCRSTYRKIFPRRCRYCKSQYTKTDGIVGTDIIHKFYKCRDKGGEIDMDEGTCDAFRGKEGYIVE